MEADRSWIVRHVDQLVGTESEVLADFLPPRCTALQACHCPGRGVTQAIRLRNLGGERVGVRIRWALRIRGARQLESEGLA
jgi:hypothetical protein